MRWGCVQGLASWHKRLGVAPRAVLGRPGWGSAIRMRNAIVRGPMPVRHDVDWLKTTQARS